MLFLGGVLDSLQPCILPVCRFVFARAETAGFPAANGLPMCWGHALTFAPWRPLAAAGGLGRAKSINNGVSCPQAFLGVALATDSVLWPPFAETLARACWPAGGIRLTRDLRVRLHRLIRLSAFAS